MVFYDYILWQTIFVAVVGFSCLFVVFFPFFFTVKWNYSFQTACDTILKHFNVSQHSNKQPI